MTIKQDEPDGALRIEFFLHPKTGGFGLQIVDEGPRTLALQEVQDVLAAALRNVTARREIGDV